MMVRIFILKASVKKEACGKLVLLRGGTSTSIGNATSVFLNRRHWLVSGNRVTTKEKGKEKWKESEHLDQRPLSSFRPFKAANN